jgi:hypothetical protein
VQVGIDASASTVAQLRSKPSAAELAVTMGHTAEPNVEEPFRLVYVVFNTYFRDSGPGRSGPKYKDGVAVANARVLPDVRLRHSGDAFGWDIGSLRWRHRCWSCRLLIASQKIDAVA